MDDEGRVVVSWAQCCKELWRKIDAGALAQYDMIFERIASRGIKPTLVLRTCDVPGWMLLHDGWLYEGSADTFVRFATDLMDHYGDKVDWEIRAIVPESLARATRDEIAFASKKSKVARDLTRAHYMVLATARAIIYAHNVGLKVAATVECESGLDALPVQTMRDIQQTGAVPDEMQRYVLKRTPGFKVTREDRQDFADGIPDSEAVRFKATIIETENRIS